jgi:hypothetical protein
MSLSFRRMSPQSGRGASVAVVAMDSMGFRAVPFGVLAFNSSLVMGSGSDMSGQPPGYIENNKQTPPNTCRPFWEHNRPTTREMAEQKHPISFTFQYASDHRTETERPPGKRFDKLWRSKIMLTSCDVSVCCLVFGVHATV